MFHTISTIGLIAGPVAVIVGLVMEADEMSQHFEDGLTGRTGEIGCAAMIAGTVVFIVSLAAKVFL